MTGFFSTIRANTAEPATRRFALQSGAPVPHCPGGRGGRAPHPVYSKVLPTGLLSSNPLI